MQAHYKKLVPQKYTKSNNCNCKYMNHMCKNCSLKYNNNNSRENDIQTYEISINKNNNKAYFNGESGIGGEKGYNGEFDSKYMYNDSKLSSKFIDSFNNSCSTFNGASSYIHNNTFDSTNANSLRNNNNNNINKYNNYNNNIKYNYQNNIKNKKENNIASYGIKDINSSYKLEGINNIIDSTYPINNINNTYNDLDYEQLKSNYYKSLYKNIEENNDKIIMQDLKPFNEYEAFKQLKNFPHFNTSLEYISDNPIKINNNQLSTALLLREISHRQSLEKLMKKYNKKNRHKHKHNHNHNHKSHDKNKDSDNNDNKNKYNRREDNLLSIQHIELYSPANNEKQPNIQLLSSLFSFVNSLKSVFSADKKELKMKDFISNPGELGLVLDGLEEEIKEKAWKEKLTSSISYSPNPWKNQKENINKNNISSDSNLNNTSSNTHNYKEKNCVACLLGCGVSKSGYSSMEFNPYFHRKNNEKNICRSHTNLKNKYSKDLNKNTKGNSRKNISKFKNEYKDNNKGRNSSNMNMSMNDMSFNNNINKSMNNNNIDIINENNNDYFNNKTMDEDEKIRKKFGLID